MRTLIETEASQIDECAKILQMWIAQVGSGEIVPGRGFYLEKIHHWQFIPYPAFPNAGIAYFRCLLDIEISWTPPETKKSPRLPLVGKSLGFTRDEAIAIANDPEIYTWADLIARLEYWLSHARALATQASEGEMQEEAAKRSQAQQKAPGS